MNTLGATATWGGGVCETNGVSLHYLADARLKTHLAAFDVLTPPNPAYRDVVRAIDVPTLLVIG